MDCKHEFIRVEQNYGEWQGCCKTISVKVCEYCLKTPHEIELERQLAAKDEQIKIMRNHENCIYNGKSNDSWCDYIAGDLWEGENMGKVCSNWQWEGKGDE